MFNIQLMWSCDQDILDVLISSNCLSWTAVEIKKREKRVTFLTVFAIFSHIIHIKKWYKNSLADNLQWCKLSAVQCIVVVITDRAICIPILEV